MDVGDLVKPKSLGNPLCCGSGHYSHAVVGKMEPFTLVSESGDMVWSVSYKPEDVNVIGKAEPEVLKTCLQRLERDRATKLSPSAT